MLARVLFTLFSALIFSILELNAQCSTSSFSLEQPVCIDQTVKISNTSTGAVEFEWDFCSGDLTSEPNSNIVINNANFFRSRSLKLIEENNLWYGFSISSTANILMRLDFGNNLENMPVYNNLGNIDGGLSSSFAFDMIQYNDVWHIFVANFGNNTILRYSFENGIFNAPTLNILNTGDAFAMAGPNGIKVVQNDSEYHAFVTVGTNTGNTKIVRLDLGGSPLNLNPDTTDILVSGSNQLRGIDLIKECNNWYGLILSQGTNNLYKVSFGTELNNEFTTIILLYDSGIFNTPVSIKAFNESGRFYCLVSNSRVDDQNTAFYITDFGLSLSDDNLIIRKQFYPEMSGGIYAIEVVDKISQWYAFTFNLATRNLLRFDFDNNCAVFPRISNDFEPLVSYTAQGDYSISLNSTDGYENVVYSSNEITVSAFTAPPISYTSQNICRSNPIQFISQSTSSGLTYSWDFGDATTSTDANPSHTYTLAGEYEVTLEVSDGTCENFTRQTITVYDEPQPTFVAPTGITCTNQLLNIVNGTLGDFGGNESWEWQIDDVSVSNARDLDFTFTSGGMKEIKLIASIPGCSVEFTQNVEILDGPDPSFQVDDACVGTLMEFSNTSLGQVASYLWDFDNGFTSNLENPSFEYADPGSYLVSLTVENSLGCITTFENIVEVFASPEVQFSNDLSCELNVTQFNDLSTVSGANITAWRWDFDDPDAESNSSSDQNSTHIFSRNGDFDVKLVTTSVFGCSDSVTQIVSVLEAPKADFTFDNACIGEAVQFQNTSIPVSGESITSFEWDIAGTFSNEESPTLALGAAGDYEVTLFTTSENLCLGSVTKTISIAQSPDLEIGIDRNCQNESVKFFDLTSASVDAIESWVWNFNNQGMASDSLAFYRFDDAGTFDVGLQVTTFNGCEFAIQQEVVINSAPEADFQASVNFGAPPLNVVFENQSTGASSYFWKFDEINTSQQESLQFTYNELGEYETELIAYSDLNCSDTTRQIISVLIPELDVVLNDVVIPDDNDAPIILNLANNGSLTLNQLSANIDLGGEIQLREDFEILIRPGESTNYAMQLNILDRDIAYLCIEVSAAFPGIEDQTLGNNSICETFSDQTLIVSNAFPNPADNVLNFEAVSSRSGSFQIVIRDLSGGIVKSYKQEVLEGRIPLKIDISQLRIGMYFLQIPELNQVQKFNIAR